MVISSTVLAVVMIRWLIFFDSNIIRFLIPQDTAAEFKYKLHVALNDPSLPRPPVPFVRPRMPSAASSMSVRVLDSLSLLLNKHMQYIMFRGMIVFTH